jgi:hypothetical protein
MNEQILSLLKHLDEALVPLAQLGEHFDLYHLGRSALVMHYGFLLTTNDVDFVAMKNPNLDEKAIELLARIPRWPKDWGFI